MLLPQAGAALHIASGPLQNMLPPLHVACNLGRRTMAKLLLHHGANVNQLDSRHLTVLHISCARGDASMIELLLQNGADVDTVYLGDEEYGRTALHDVCKAGHKVCTKLLLQHSADISAVGQHG